MWGTFLQIAQNPAGRKSPNTAQWVGEGGQEPVTGMAQAQSPAPSPSRDPTTLNCQNNCSACEVRKGVSG